jgi:hypothetical protein
MISAGRSQFADLAKDVSRSLALAFGKSDG